MAQQHPQPGSDPEFDLTYPRPQLCRQEWLDLNGQWLFAYDDEDRGLSEHWERPRDNPAEIFDRTITVPYPPESEASGINDPSFHPICWYYRALTDAEISTVRGSGQRVILNCGAADYQAHMWVDGTLVATHTGGHTPISCDITDALDANREEHTLVIRAFDDPADVSQPRGKQDWEAEPHAIWYRRTTGIWQPVWLECVEPVHITSIWWRSTIDDATVRASIELSRLPEPDTTLTVRLTLDGEVLASVSVAALAAHVDVPIPIRAIAQGQDHEKYLWYVDSPTLIDAEVSLSGGDRVWSYCGFSSVMIDEGALLLNRRPFYMRSVLEQGFWPQSHLAAPSPEAIKREVELIRSLGFNAVRIHQKIEDPRFLYWCDRLGLAVWGEFPAAYEFSDRAITRTVAEVTEEILRDRSHPSIIAWVPFNESWGVSHIAVDERQQGFTRAVVELIRTLDPDRPVISNDGWEHTDSDIVTIHDYTGDPDDMTRRYGTADSVDALMVGMGPSSRHVLVGDAVHGDRPVMVTEMGGTRFLVGDEGETWGYNTVSSADEYRDQLTRIVGALRQAHGVQGFCYTQLTDTLQEANGVCDEQRVPKLPLEDFQKIFGV